MRFCQLTRILELVPNDKILAERTLQPEEDYLKDHFPRFPVMPGVLMLEALYQASALLVRATQGYQSGLVTLKQAKNVKFADFVQPGQTLEIEASLFKQDENIYTLKASGSKGGKIAVSGRLVLECHQELEGTSFDAHSSKFMKDLTAELQSA